MADETKTVLELIDKQTTAKLLTDLVNISSPTGEEAEIAKYLFDRFEKVGLKAILQEADQDRFNAVGVLEGDGSGLSDLGALQNLCASYPENKFLVTVLARENQHELCVLARKFRNLHIFGCWWFMNIPQLIDETTRMRLELIGTSVTPQHSDCRVLDQLVYKWRHSRAIIGDVLADKYEDLATTGWQPARAEIERDVRDLLGGALEKFIAR